jgi:hypothetical protein
MNVNIKDFNVKMELKNKGIELDVYDSSGSHLGDLVVTKTRLIWCPDKTSRQNGHAVSWTDFIEYMTNR